MLVHIVSLHSLVYSSVTSVMPVEFEYNQSTEQAFYFIVDATIDGISIEEGDWIAAFKGLATCFAVVYPRPFDGVQLFFGQLKVPHGFGVGIRMAY